MRVLRLLLAAVVVAAALAAGFLFFAAVVVVGLLAFLAQIFWRRSRAGRTSPGAGSSAVRPPGAGEEVIDIQATDVPPDLPPGRPGGGA